MSNTPDHSASPSDSEPYVLTESSNGILHITLNRPASYNVLSEEMLAALQSCIDDIDDDQRVVVIKSLGKAFCAGHDLKQMRDNPDQAYYNTLFKTCSRFMNSLLAIKQPVIAQVDGIATAPSVPLSRNVSRKRAFEMLMTGEFISADKAMEWGLLNQVVEVEDLDAAVLALADKIVKKSAVAVATGKGLFYKQLEMPLENAYVLAGETMACNMMAEDVSEGIDAGASFSVRTVLINYPLLKLGCA